MTEEEFLKQSTLPDLAPPMEPRWSILPHKIGPYQIKSLLSKGGMSYLYLGVHPSTAQPIVIKVLSPKFLTQRDMTSRFLKEAEIIAMTNHPNIVKLYGQGTWEKGVYIALEFIQGISLRQFIQQKSLSQRRGLEIVLQVAYALCHLHTHGVIHRDLKPENILITETGEIKVIDFGIAQLQGDVEPGFGAKGRRMMGTPVYMSPEQKENPQAVSYGSDIYSLGIITYELLLGRLSYGVIHLALLPKNLRTIVDKALKLDPLERYSDIVDFITDISHYLKESEETKEDMPDEMLGMIQYMRKLLIPAKIPSWPQVEMGMALTQGTVLSGLYLDFFRLPDNCLCIVLAEPLDTGLTSLFHSATLRGMVRMAVEQAFESGKKESHATKMLRSAARALFEDPVRQAFGLSLVVLNPDKDALSFVSCGFGNLWHIPDGNHEPRALSTLNPALGSEPHTPLLETTDNWNSGDTLILHSLKTTEPSSGWMKEHLLLAAQPMAERILERLTNNQQRAAAVLSIHRIF